MDSLYTILTIKLMAHVGAQYLVPCYSKSKTAPRNDRFFAALFDVGDISAAFVHFRNVAVGLQTGAISFPTLSFDTL